MLQAQVRIALGRQIVQDIAGSGGELPVITLEPELEQLLQARCRARAASNAALEPGLAERLQARLAESAQRQEASGEPAVLMVAPPLRATLARFTRASVPGCTCWPGMRFPITAACAWSPRSVDSYGDGELNRMKMKRYVAADMRSALRAIREEQGPDAVILSTAQARGGRGGLRRG